MSPPCPSNALNLIFIDLMISRETFLCTYSIMTFGYARQVFLTAIDLTFINTRQVLVFLRGYCTIMYGNFPEESKLLFQVVGKLSSKRSREVSCSIPPVTEEVTDDGFHVVCDLYL